MKQDRERWNHNFHYHRVALDALPVDCRRVLEVGCGEGTLARKLAGRADVVVALDCDEPVLGRARSSGCSPAIQYTLGDVLTYPFADASFDAVVSVATLHHMDEHAALQRMAALVRPGGVLVVVGLARSRAAIDWAYDAIGFGASRMLQLRRPRFEPDVPIVWPPPSTYGEIRTLAHETLAGVRYTRHVLFRYSLVWTKPSD